MASASPPSPLPSSSSSPRPLPQSVPLPDAPSRLSSASSPPAPAASAAGGSSQQSDPTSLPPPATDSASAAPSSASAPPSPPLSSPLSSPSTSPYKSMNTHFSVLAPSPPLSPTPLSPSSQSSSPRGSESRPSSDLEDAVGDVDCIRAGSVVGMKVRSHLEYKTGAKTQTWRTAYFTFDEMTCSVFQYDKPGADAKEIYEVGGVLQRTNRMFKRKNRFDVILLDRTVLAFAAPTPEVCEQFVSSMSAICSPTNNAALRQLRTEFSAESRKVISLTSSVDMWRTKFTELNRLYALADGGVKAAKSKLALDRIAQTFRRFSPFAFAFHALKAHMQQQQQQQKDRNVITLARLQTVMNNWANRVVMVHFIRWVRFCVVDDVKSKCFSLERAETIKAVKQKLTGTGMFLDLIGEIRRTEIKVLEAELDALDAREQLERAMAAGGMARSGGGGGGGGGALDLLRKMEAVYDEVVGAGDLMLGPAPTSPIPREDFGPAGTETPDIQLNASYDEMDADNNNGGGDRGAMLLEEDDSEDSHLTFVPQQVKRIERRLSQSGGSGIISPNKK